ncbi:MAG: MerR family transcriptional regulator [Desulfobacteraceae bacterium]|nr:MerR family transcriptional regulator [Desulfobacteraceae bacterium]
MKAKQYEIRYVSLRTGLNPHRIRAWERRYGAVCPVRTRTNRRLYAESDIQRLRLLREAVEAGHRISGIGRLSTAALKKLVLRDTGGDGSGNAPKTTMGPTSVVHSIKALKIEAYRAVEALDTAAFKKGLEHAAAAFPRRRFLEDFLSPLFANIGKAWSAGALSIACEHMASAVARSFLGDLLQQETTVESGARILVATPAGHRHEIGALVSALCASEAGWFPVYLGPDLPAREIVAAARRVSGRAVALSIGHDSRRAALCGELRKLHKGLNGSAVLLAGGPGIHAVRDDLKGIDIRWCAGLSDFSRQLRHLRTDPLPKGGPP